MSNAEDYAPPTSVSPGSDRDIPVFADGDATGPARLILPRHKAPQVSALEVHEVAAGAIPAASQMAGRVIRTWASGEAQSLAISDGAAWWNLVPAPVA